MSRTLSPRFQFKKCALATGLLSALLHASMSHATPSVYTFSVNGATATTGTMQLNTGSLGSGVLANPSVLTSGANPFNYAVAYFVPTLSNGAFIFGQSQAPTDSVMIVYSGFFNPNTPGAGALAGNDDTTLGGHESILGAGANVSCGGSPDLCPQVGLSVTGGQIYSIVISTFGTGDTLGTPLNLVFYTNGDGQFYAAPPAPPATVGGVLNSATLQGNNPALAGARVIDATPQLLALFSGLNTNQLRSDAASQTLPLLTGASTNAISNSLAAINDVIQARQGSTSGLSSGDSLFSEQQFWIKSFGSWADQNQRNGVAGFDADSKGLALGLDAAVSDNARLGLAFAYATTDINSDSAIAPQSAEIDTYQLIGYGSYALTPATELNFQLDVGQNRTEGQRSIGFAGTTAKSDYDGYSAHAGVGIAHDLRLTEQLTFTPSARVDYTWIGDDSYAEKGAGLLNLDVDSRDTEALLLSLDGKLDYALNSSTVLSANLGGGYDTINESNSITSAYAGAATATFSTEGLELEPWLARAGLGLSHTLPSGTEVSLRYDAEVRSDFTNQGASLKARWAF
ncbi:autotransporter outer membrane beta-barrel domain-containing protein [Pseudomonas sp.]|jgi:outer membrane autotransporter protein|uniref:autotransporter outer membrane beta-barrel domain-containing protein n=1 Tax=Pseudomonas sp. TaxID=306 RepID=UPI0037C628E9